MKQLGEGILLHRRSYSESSVILDVFTRDHGLQTYLFQGAKKKKGTVLIPLCPMEFEYYQRNDSSLAKMTKLEAKHATSLALFDPLKSSISFFCAELLLKSLPHGQRDNQLYHFVNEEIQWLTQSNELSNYVLWYLVKFTEQVGIQPKIEGFQSRVFDFEKGVLSAEKPLHIAFHEGEEIMYIQQAYVISKNLFLAQEINRTVRANLIDMMLDYIRYHLPNMRKLESLEIIRTVF